MTDLDALDRKAAEALGWEMDGLILVDGGPTNPGIFAGPRVGYYPDRYSPTRIPAQAMALFEQMLNGGTRLLVDMRAETSLFLRLTDQGWKLLIEAKDPSLLVRITRAFVAWTEECKTDG